MLKGQSLWVIGQKKVVCFVSDITEFAVYIILIRLIYSIFDTSSGFSVSGLTFTRVGANA